MKITNKNVNAIVISEAKIALAEEVPVVTAAAVVEVVLVEE